MRRFYVVLVVLAGTLMAACAGNSAQPTEVVASPTEAPSLVEPTSMPTTVPIPTLEPTAVPTEVPTEPPTPTATSEPTVLEVADQMFSECVAKPHWEKFTWERYERQLRDQMLAAHPEWDTRGYVRNYGIGRLFAQDGKEWSWYATTVGSNVDYHPNPFSVVDLAHLWDQPYSDTFQPTSEDCALFILVFEKVPENSDGDGIIVGEAYLFYEVGGQDPHLFDGELRELHFDFPLASDQEEIQRLYALERATDKAVEETVLRDCLRVATFPPATASSAAVQEFESWMNQYINSLLLESVGEGVTPQNQPDLYLLPEGAQTGCVVLLHRDLNGDASLIYETKNGVVKVPFTVPSDP